MPKLIDLTGQKFGRLTVIERLESETNNAGKKVVMYKCKCECGNIIKTSGRLLKTGDKKSCGCLYKEYHKLGHTINYKHGKYDTRLYKVWQQMNHRCSCKTCKSYKNYGGRGISVCSEWKNDFMKFYDWAMANGYDENALKGECTIDRINVNGNYEPSNCRWVNCLIQSRNKRHVSGVSFNKRARSWEAHIGINGNKIHLGYFKDIEEAKIARLNAENVYWGKNR